MNAKTIVSISVSFGAGILIGGGLGIMLGHRYAEEKYREELADIRRYYRENRAVKSTEEAGINVNYSVEQINEAIKDHVETPNSDVDGDDDKVIDDREARTEEDYTDYTKCYKLTDEEIKENNESYLESLKMAVYDALKHPSDIDKCPYTVHELYLNNYDDDKYEDLARDKGYRILDDCVFYAREKMLVAYEKDDDGSILSESEVEDVNYEIIQRLSNGSYSDHIQVVDYERDTIFCIERTAQEYEPLDKTGEEENDKEEWSAPHKV